MEQSGKNHEFSEIGRIRQQHPLRREENGKKPVEEQKRVGRYLRHRMIEDRTPGLIRASTPAEARMSSAVRQQSGDAHPRRDQRAQTEALGTNHSSKITVRITNTKSAAIPGLPSFIPRL